MKFDQPAGPNPIDAERVVGHATPRVEGALKVAGQARYAYEHAGDAPPQPACAYGHVVGAAIAKGRIRAIDLSAARAAPGVLAVVTAQTAGPLGKGQKNTVPLLAGPEVAHYHQAVAVVVAETFEQARAAAALVKVDYDAATGAYDLAAASAGAPLAPDDGGTKAETRVGDFGSAFDAAPVQLDATYRTPDQTHAMMEPHASIAAWQGDQLTVWTSNQMIAWTVKDLARTLHLQPGQVRVVSPYVGGGFGGKLFLRADAVLAALGARAAGRPVKVALTRPLMANNTTHRPATIQRLRIGAEKDGRITAFAHESWSGDQKGGGPETAVNQSRLLYAAPNRYTAMRLAVLDLPEGNSMRAPGEAPGMMALEVAMDEMAEQLGLDPIEFRLRNDAKEDPEKPGRPFTQQNLAECLRLGAARFGWDQRRPRPATRREGDWWIGMGVAAAFRNNLLVKSAARVRLEGQDGAPGGVRAVVETDMTDIGTGSYTILAQTAAEMLGLALEQVEVRLGDSRFPVAAGSGGQFGAANSTAGLFYACEELRSRVAARLHLPAEGTRFADGHVQAGGRRIALADALADGPLEAEGKVEYGDIAKRAQQSTFGAHFVEVGVDAYTAEVRVRRMLAVCAAGRILNPMAARSQVIGAMTMGVGAALTEALEVDTRRGFFVNHDLAGYEVPAHADIAQQEVIFLDVPDPWSTPMKAKGVAELGICGVAAAVANAVYNACGVRVRDYPVTLDKLLAKMPPVA